MAGLLLDAGPLVAFIMFALKPGCSGEHGLVQQYNSEMEARLLKLVEAAHRHVSVPNVLSEASNHLGSADQQAVPNAARGLAEYIVRIDELYQPSGELVRRQEYDSLGLADTAIFSLHSRLKSERVKVVTQDYQLSNRLWQVGVDCVNVMHWRTPK